MLCPDCQGADSPLTVSTRSSHSAYRSLSQVGDKCERPVKIGFVRSPCPAARRTQVPSSYCLTSLRFWLCLDTFQPSWVRPPGVSDFDLAGRDEADGCHRSGCVQIGNDRAPHSRSARGAVTQLIPPRLKRGRNVKVLWRLALFGRLQEPQNARNSLFCNNLHHRHFGFVWTLFNPLGSTGQASGVPTLRVVAGLTAAANRAASRLPKMVGTIPTYSVYD
jgi:hypothetical protein